MSRPFNHPMSREEVMAAIMECTEKLGHVPSYVELTRTTKVSSRAIVRHFGTFTRALRACNLERHCGGQRLPMEKLLGDWCRVVRELKKIPSKAEYVHLGQHSPTPLKERFGRWSQVPRGTRLHLEEQGRTEEWTDVVDLIREYEQGRDGLERLAQDCAQQDPSLINPSLTKPRIIQPSIIKPRIMKDRPLYGPLVRPYPLIHGPMNEAGVIYLFGTLSEKLGFVVTRIQGEFPDCEAMRLVDEDRWQRVRIEFEYESRNFLKHLHDVNGCDLIVCWKHNWPECPLEVVELSKIVGQIG
ncbi:MAG: hypothetical protein LAO78_07440 [Acidobacteriia bacterium]|nr:hypothetical protein [Terriglobia bacterium]